MPIPPVAIGDIIQVIVNSRCEGQVIKNVLYYKSLAGREGTYQEGIDELLVGLTIDDVSSLTDAMTPLMGPNATIEFVQAQRVYPQRDIYVRRVVNQAGVHDDDCDAPNLAAVVVKQTERVGRGKSGTFHAGGLASTLYAKGEFTAPGQTLLKVLADTLKIDMVDAVPGAGFRPGTFNPTLGTPDNFNPIVGTSVMPTVRVMRRRTVGVGE